MKWASKGEGLSPLAGGLSESTRRWRSHHEAACQRVVGWIRKLKDPGIRWIGLYGAGKTQARSEHDPSERLAEELSAPCACQAVPASFQSAG